MQDIEALVILNNIPKLGPHRIRQLIDHFGSPAKILKAQVQEIQTLPGFGPTLAKSISQWQANEFWEKDLELIQRFGVQLLPFTSQNYPKCLSDIPNAPTLLYILGNWDKDYFEQSIAIIGTRNASLYGIECAKGFAAELAEQGSTIISGLARGIDTAAHQGALQSGNTIAVIGSGLANIYPSENQALAKKIQDTGAIVSEFPMYTPPDRQNFPQRNRIVSGLSKLLFLVEAPIKSGAMLTMGLGEKHGKALYALPGRIDNENFRGNHHLIKEGRARLVEKAQDLLSYFGDLFHYQGFSKKSPPQTPNLLGEEADLFQRMPSEEKNIDELLNITKLPIAKLSVLLMSLVLKGIVREYPGKIYKKIGYNYG